MGAGVGFKSQSLDLSLVSPNGMSCNNLFQISLVIFVSTMGRMQSAPLSSPLRGSNEGSPVEGRLTMGPDVTRNSCSRHNQSEREMSICPSQRCYSEAPVLTQHQDGALAVPSPQDPSPCSWSYPTGSKRGHKYLLLENILKSSVHEPSKHRL